MIRMPTKDPRIDEYINASADFARPILKHLRKLVHKASPEIEETMKWGFPHFDYKGILCSFAAFKSHCRFNFWKASLMKDPQQIMTQMEKASMGGFDKITSLSDLPSEEVFLEYMQEALKLNEEGVKVSAKPKAGAKKTYSIPQDLSAALSKNKSAKANFEAFSPSHQREYITWIEEAKTGATREKRLTTTIEWLEEGKSRNWKYK
jgi:uncharacterized protein YdeI (YjbR/CyaY-like superfamily)